MSPSALIEAIADEARAMPFLDIDPRALLERDLPLSAPGRWSANRHCWLVRASDHWLAVNLAREEDRAALPAWLRCDDERPSIGAMATMIAEQSAGALLEQAVLLGLPVAIVGETVPVAQVSAEALQAARQPPRGLKVLDMSALWAGPLCGALLADAGMAVTRLEFATRPDPTRTATPQLDQRLNGRKQRFTIPDIDTLQDAFTQADIVITSARPHALARLGLAPDVLLARHPRLIWVAITAHGFHGEQGLRAGFGDDCAAAGGLIHWQSGEPHFLGDALADPLTGLRAARRVFDHLARGTSGLIDAALAATAADFASAAGLR
jgi:CoA-transferase family III